MITLPAAVYHARPEANKSLLDRINEAPAKAKAYLEQPRPEPTPAMRFGTAVHAAVLEPDTLLCAPRFNLRSHDGKAEAAAFAAENAGKVIADPEMHAEVMACREGVLAHPVARRILDDGIAEQSVFSELCGVPCKARPDWFRPSASLIADLKTTQSAHPDDFAKSIATFRYHVQHAFYVDVCEAAGVPIRSFVFIAVEKTPPYLCAVYVLDPADVQRGRVAYERNLATLAECRASGRWPGYSNTIQSIRLPKWAITKELL